jgi:esterase/lipase
MFRSRLIKLAIIALLLVDGLSLWADESVLHSPSGLEAIVPAPGLPFQDYVDQNSARIREVLARDYFALNDEPFGPGYGIDKTLAMRAPYEWQPSTTECADGQPRMGFLLIHGLTDSPYLLSDVAASLRERYPCALQRGLLLPGHSTVPGDTLEMRFEDWMTVTEYGVNSFRADVDALFMVGFSTGTSLSVRYVDAHRDDQLIKGLIMLSPAIAARSRLAFLSPYVRWFSDWLSEHGEHDAARYESFSMNAGAEFYELSSSLSSASFTPIDVPVFMAGSSADATVNMETAREFFCTKTPRGARTMLWYQATDLDASPQAQCDGLLVLPAQSSMHRVVNLSHTSISMAPDNPHYGLDADYSMCLQYGEGSSDFSACVLDDGQTVYGESGLGSDGRFEGKLIRRASFNPHYKQMIEHIERFIESVN